MKGYSFQENLKLQKKRKHALALGTHFLNVQLNVLLVENNDCFV